MEPSQMKPVADEVAAEHDFGEIVGSWDPHDRGDAKGKLGCSGVLVVLGLILAGIGWALDNLTVQLIMWILAGMMVVSALSFLFKGLLDLARSGSRALFLYRAGLVQMKDGEVTEVVDLRHSTVTESVVQHYKGGVKSGDPMITFTLDGPHGSSTLTGSNVFGGTVLPQIKQTATEARVPVVLEALQRGEEVPFGDVALTGSGVRLHGGPVVPFNEIHALRTDRGSFEIDHGLVNRATHSQPIGTTPDFAVLSAILAGSSGKSWE